MSYPTTPTRPVAAAAALPRERRSGPIPAVCRSGHSSPQATEPLTGQGVRATDVTGGTTARPRDGQRPVISGTTARAGRGRPPVTGGMTPGTSGGLPVGGENVLLDGVIA
ncbi:hypothetical protein [Streptomyces sp. NPDC005573]|uniref:hypothetical protein n=1 Tax=Streptomyces sp. NPDC005573 TaxID=3156890 RepID=UPI0033ABCEC2